MTFQVCSSSRMSLSSKIVSEYDQDISQSQTTDKPMALRGRATQQEDKLSKAIRSPFPIKVFAKLEWT